MISWAYQQGPVVFNFYAMLHWKDLDNALTWFFLIFSFLYLFHYFESIVNLQHFLKYLKVLHYTIYVPQLEHPDRDITVSQSRGKNIKKIK